MWSHEIVPTYSGIILRVFGYAVRLSGGADTCSLQSLIVSDDFSQVFDESQFADTVVHLIRNGVWIEIVPDANAPLDQLNDPGISTTIHVISGCNPGYRETDEANALRHIHMEQCLREVGADPQSAIGMSPDGSWVEPSWAVTGLTRDQACAVGREFGQVAVFEIDARRIHVVRCIDSTAASSKPYRTGCRSNPERGPES